MTVCFNKLFSTKRGAKSSSSKAAKSPSPRPPTQTEDNQSLALQVEALQAQLEEQTKLARDQVKFKLSIDTFVLFFL